MPDKQGQRIEKDWFLHAEHDLETARLIFRQGGYTDTIAVILQQAAEKYLKGYLLSKGWKLKKTHDLEVLVAEAITHTKEFEQFLDFARTVSAFYLEDRYPPGPPVDYPRNEIAALLEQTEKLIALIRSQTE